MLVQNILTSQPDKVNVLGRVCWLGALHVQNAPCPQDKLAYLPSEHTHAWLSVTWDAMAAQIEMLLYGLGHLKSCCS